MTQIKKTTTTNTKKKTKKHEQFLSHQYWGQKLHFFSVFCALSYIIQKRHHIREEEIQYLSLKKQS